MVRDETNDVCEEAAEEGRAMMGPSSSVESCCASKSSVPLRGVVASGAELAAAAEVDMHLTDLNGAVVAPNRDSCRRRGLFCELSIDKPLSSDLKEPVDEETEGVGEPFLLCCCAFALCNNPARSSDEPTLC